MNRSPNARELAFHSLLSSEKNGKYSNLELDSVLKKNPLSPADKNLYTTLFYGVLERKISLDHLIESYSSRPLSSLSKGVQQVLRLGLYQIFYLDRIPDNAAVNESVQLIKNTKEASAASFVNALLRTACRNKEQGFRFKNESENQRLSVIYSYPLWMVELWIKAYGNKKACRIMDAQNQKSALTIRVNTLKTDRDSLAKRLLDHGVETTPCPEAASALQIHGNFSLQASEEFKEGLFFVQDLSSQIACQLLAPAPGETVFDVCCCPGGKSFHAAMLMNNLGTLRCCDLHPSKLTLVKQGASNLGIRCLDVFPNDSSQLKEEWIGTADKVICDVPCSGLGVIGKKPDIRQKEQKEILRLPQIQKNILNASARYLKKGGTLLYSTCTLNPEENERITEEFLKNNSGFRRSPTLSEPLTIFPEAHNKDGFFIDLIERTESP